MLSMNVIKFMMHHVFAFCEYTLHWNPDDSWELHFAHIYCTKLPSFVAQAYKFDLFLSSSVSGLANPWVFTSSFCHKAEQFQEFIEFLSKNLLFREERIIFMKLPWIYWKKLYLRAEIFKKSPWYIFYVLLIRKFPQKSCTVEHCFTGMHDLNGKFTYDDFFRKTHAPLYI